MRNGLYLSIEEWNGICIQEIEGVDGGPHRDKLPYSGNPFKTFERKASFQYLISNNIFKYFLIGKCSMWRKSKNRFLRMSLFGGKIISKRILLNYDMFNGVFF